MNIITIDSPNEYSFYSKEIRTISDLKGFNNAYKSYKEHFEVLNTLNSFDDFGVLIHTELKDCGESKVNSSFTNVSISYLILFDNVNQLPVRLEDFPSWFLLELVG